MGQDKWVGTRVVIMPSYPGSHCSHPYQAPPPAPDIRRAACSPPPGPAHYCHCNSNREGHIDRRCRLMLTRTAEVGCGCW